MRMSRATRNVTIVVLAFVFVGGLVVVAHFRAPSRVLPPQSPETARLRFSKTENAFFALQEARDLIPERPFVDPRKTVDYAFGPMGKFTGVCLADDNPDHIAWVRACDPAIKRAREALKMDHMLLPVDFAMINHPWDDINKCHRLGEITNVMLAAAVL
jgi:hypothetical protein